MALAREATMSETVQKRYTAEIRAAAAEGYDATGVLSATNVDRTGDTISQKAYQPYVGKRIPALFAHDHERIIGTWENLRISKNQLIGDLKLAGTRVSDYIKALLDANVPLANSIGFRAKGTPNKTGGLHYDDIQLYEASVVAVGMHQDALMIAKSLDLEITEDEITESVEHASEDDQLVVQMRAHDARTRAAAAIQKANDAISFKRKK